MTTTRLYYTDSYLTNFDARVVDAADEGRRVYLDQTAFYPTSGGQPNDLGTLGGVRIADVIDEGDRIAHILESSLPGDATSVAGSIDWQRRFDYMQQHTGQHLLSAVLEESYGYHTVSVHFGSDYSSLDLDVETVSADRVIDAERRANLIAAENRPVTTSFEDASQASGLRKASDREGMTGSQRVRWHPRTRDGRDRRHSHSQGRPRAEVGAPRVRVWSPCRRSGTSRLRSARAHRRRALGVAGRRAVAGERSK